jgi:tRNA (guanine26-N2/guanine27-N2)-dimethyltransferase
MRVSEGEVTISVPEGSDEGRGEHVFFNPDQELNRDVMVATLRAVRDDADPGSYVDATAASGIRGVRAGREGWRVTCCDVDEAAVERCEANLARNDVAGEVRHRDARALLYDEAFDVVDVDPFGTPMPFVDAAVNGTRELLCLTATDTAPLCGAHFRSGVRSYATVPHNTEYHAEMGVRVLLSAVVRVAARHDVAAQPVLTHASDHYVRTYLDLERGARAADACVDELGFVYHCQHCLWRDAQRRLIADAPAACPHCGEDLQVAGPLWLARSCDRDFVAAVAEEISAEMGTADRAPALLATIRAELDTPTHYDQHRLTKRWGRGATAMEEFLERVREAGFAASRTHYGGTTFKTDADVAAIREATEQ